MYETFKGVHGIIATRGATKTYIGEKSGLDFAIDHFHGFVGKHESILNLIFIDLHQLACREREGERGREGERERERERE